MPPTRATRGRILVLDNERTVEGDIERVGNQYRIRRGIGESWIPGDKALRLCANREEAYRFLKGRFNLEDPDECLRLARWCQAEGLNERALENVSVAVQLRPGHGESRRFLANLQCAAAAKPATSPPVHPSTPADTTAIPDLNNEALGLFATKVQPILMNACVSCHATGRGGTFKLTRIPLESGPANRRPLQQNLAAVLAQVNMEKPQNSPFLTKAITAHGEMAQAPLSSRQKTAYFILEDWVHTTLAENPHLRDQASAGLGNKAKPPVVPGPSASPSTETPVSRSSPPGGPAAKPAPAESLPASAGARTFAANRPTSPDKPAASPADPVDPFDPEPFNRQAHPETK